MIVEVVKSDALGKERVDRHVDVRSVDLPSTRGMVPADVSKTVNGPARVTITAAGDELLETEISLGAEMDVAVEFKRLGGDDD